MKYTPEQIKGFQETVAKVLKTGTINQQDKKQIEEVLTFLTGQSWKGRCIGCSMAKVALILKNYHNVVLKEQAAQAASTTPTTEDNSITTEKKKAGRPKKSKEESYKPEQL